MKAGLEDDFTQDTLDADETWQLLQFIGDRANSGELPIGVFGTGGLVAVVAGTFTAAIVRDALKARVDGVGPIRRDPNPLWVAYLAEILR